MANEPTQANFIRCCFRQIVYTCLIAISFLWSALPTSASQLPLLVVADYGGNVSERMLWIDELRESGQPVVFDGVCRSACTLFSILPSEQVCATNRAVFMFHAPSLPLTVPEPRRSELIAEETTRMFSLYPLGIREWLNAHGGLTTTWLFMPPADVLKVIQPCDTSHKSIK